MMTRVAAFAGAIFIALGLLTCRGRSSAPEVPTLPPLDTPAVRASTPQPQNLQRTPARDPLAISAKPPVPERPTATPRPLPWPTFTPGPAPQSQHRLLYARGGRFWTANADRSGVRELKFKNPSPALMSPFKDPGRGWLSPDGHQLLYFTGRTGELWIGDVTTLNNTQLATALMLQTPDRDRQLDIERALVDQEIAWTLDGRRIVLLGMPDTFDLFMVNLGSGELTRLTNDNWREFTYKLASNDRFLAYLALDETRGRESLHILDITSGRRVDVAMEEVGRALNTDPSRPFRFERRLIWVDDSHVVFHPISSRQSGGLWVADAMTADLRHLVPDPVASFAWSEKAGAFVYGKQGDPGRLWLIRPSNPKPTVLVEGGAYAPVWSPDGRWILYSQGEPDTDRWALRIINPASGEDRLLARDVVLIQAVPSELGPAGKRYWTPDGRFILFSSVGQDYGLAEREGGYRGEAGPDLENWWILPVSGGEPRRATDLQKVFYFQAPLLSPDGAVWAFVAFSYIDRVQHLWTIPLQGGHPVKVDSDVRWFRWLP